MSIRLKKKQACNSALEKTMRIVFNWKRWWLNEKEVVFDGDIFLFAEMWKKIEMKMGEVQILTLTLKNTESPPVTFLKWYKLLRRDGKDDTKEHWKIITE